MDKIDVHRVFPCSEVSDLDSDNKLSVSMKKKKLLFQYYISPMTTGAIAF